MLPPSVAVAYSGGRDSTALLHATIGQARIQGVRVVALHVHHGLSPNADAWLEHCDAQCRRWSRRGMPVEFAAQRVTGKPAAGESVEAWARAARYEALAAMALRFDASVVLLAHHQGDQAETFLLQALRGAGLAGLSGMPDAADGAGIRWLRPWLRRPRSEIEAYLHRHRLRFVEDDSNADPRFDRNRLRLQVWPALQEAFAHAGASLARSAQWAQEADAALAELADLDLSRVAGVAGLAVAPWLALSAARRSNALRRWLRAQLNGATPASLVIRLMQELTPGRSARWPAGRGELRLYRGMLRFEPEAVTRPAKPTRSVGPQASLSIRRAGIYDIPGWGGSLRVKRIEAGGVPLAWLARLDLKARSGGEQFQAGIERPPRSLKKQYQDAGVAAWDRQGPLIYNGGQLIFVPGLGIDARVIGLTGQALVSLAWCRHPATEEEG